MAYLTPQSPVCPSCGHSKALVWITGVPLDNGPRAGRGYVRVHKHGGWRIEKTDGASHVYCPSCDTKVTERSLKP